MYGSSCDRSHFMRNFGFETIAAVIKYHQLFSKVKHWQEIPYRTDSNSFLLYPSLSSYILESVEIQQWETQKEN